MTGVPPSRGPRPASWVIMVLMVPSLVLMTTAPATTLVEVPLAVIVLSGVAFVLGDCFLAIEEWSEAVRTAMRPHRIRVKR